MQYTEIITLITKTETQDAIGNVTFTETTKNVYAKKNKVGSREFYNAVAVGIKPEAELQIRSSNYNDQEEAEYKGKRYMIIRTVPNGKNDIVLVLGKKQGING